jgi:hypothetical protein
MKRRNEDDVGPVQNGISDFVPNLPHRAGRWGKAWEKSVKRQMRQRNINQNIRLDEITLKDPPQGGRSITLPLLIPPKAGDKFVHSGISARGQAGTNLNLYRPAPQAVRTRNGPPEQTKDIHRVSR